MRSPSPSRKQGRPGLQEFTPSEASNSTWLRSHGRPPSLPSPAGKREARRCSCGSALDDESVVCPKCGKKVEVRRGVVTVRRGEVKMEDDRVCQLLTADPCVEVLIGDYVVGRTPRCSCYDANPLWEHTMRMAEFEAGAEIVVQLIIKKSNKRPLFGGKPKEDIVVAKGVLVLDEAVWSRAQVKNYLDEDIDIFVPAPPEQPTRRCSDLFASILVHIDFARSLRNCTDVSVGSSRRPTWDRIDDDEDEAQRPTTASSTPRSTGRPPSGRFGRARLRILSEESEGMQDEDASQSEMKPPSFVRDTGAGVAIPKTSHETYQSLVHEQYWGAVPPASSPIILTPMVVKILRLAEWVPCWPRRPPQRDDEVWAF